MRLENKVACVTGAASGIGKAIAESYIKEGAKVMFSDVNDFDVSSLGDSAAFTKCDVSDSKQVDALVAATVEKFGKIDIMVNDAGIGTQGGVLETTDEVWHKTIEINLSGVFYGTRAAGRWMKENNIAGSIINMSSILGEVGLQGSIAYCATKGGVVQVTHAAALDLATVKIRVNAIAPGFIETGMTKDVLANADFNKMIVAGTPLGHVGLPQDIANAALYLASDESNYVTGEVIFVDGGWRAR